ncbi:hypothetical protein R3P38DRAFT_2794604 [Favolaschia claudopus]|uniref:Uncharacterized protein n=1 Tax=Favolaschia claudopus TaxID=2862362 RepID=A0AAW0A8F5_9AGAR
MSLLKVVVREVLEVASVYRPYEDDPVKDDDFNAAAPWLQGLNALDVLSEEFDRYIAEIDPHSRLSADDLRDIRAFNLKVETSLGCRDFEKLRRSKLVRNIETLHLIQSCVTDCRIM